VSSSISLLILEISLFGQTFPVADLKRRERVDSAIPNLLAATVGENEVNVLSPRNEMMISILRHCKSVWKSQFFHTLSLPLGRGRTQNTLVCLFLRPADLYAKGCFFEHVTSKGS
jgi:hypothetical protein